VGHHGSSKLEKRNCMLELKDEMGIANLKFENHIVEMLCNHQELLSSCSKWMTDMRGRASCL
jgi:hypothetical protein